MSDLIKGSRKVSRLNSEMEVSVMVVESKASETFSNYSCSRVFPGLPDPGPLFTSPFFYCRALGTSFTRALSSRKQCEIKLKYNS
jgi:hypothetical protein